MTTRYCTRQAAIGSLLLSGAALFAGQSALSPAALAQTPTCTVPNGFSTPSGSYLPAKPVKTSTNGTVTGCAVNLGISLYRQIPFALPPTGNLRWTAPQPATWTGTVDGTFGQPSRVCPQYGRGLDEKGNYFLAEDSTEDCLVLNIHTSSPGVAADKPVYVWIHGGGGVLDDIDDPIYNGSLFAAQTGAVVVLLNYRLGVMGGMAHPGLYAETGGVTSGNYALQDLVLGLQWVRTNIRAFGGDPGNVTIAGESAGAVLVNLLVQSPLTKGLFQRAIMESNGAGQRLDSANFGFTFPTQTKAQQLGLATAQNLSPAPNRTCSNPGNPAAEVACMRGVTDLLALLNAFPPNKKVALPNIDGYVVKNGPLTGATKPHNDVQMIIGTNTDEWLIFQLVTRYGYPASTNDEYIAVLKAIWGDALWQRIYAQYPPGLNYPVGINPFAAASVRANTDGVFTCWNRRLVQNYLKNPSTQKNPIYSYQYKHLLTPPYAVLGVPHAFELFAVFGSWSTLSTLVSNVTKVPYVATPSDFQTTAVIQGYWGNFVATGDPNRRGGASTPITAATLPAWFAASAGGGFGPTIRLDAQPLQATGTDIVQSSKCDFWDSLGVYDNSAAGEQ